MLGVAIADERLDKMPKFPLTALAAPGAADAFCDAWAWAVAMLGGSGL